MPDYTLTWITANLAVGPAPMSYEELESIKAQGIDAIVNLCGEFCDLHEIERKHGFEVRFLPIADETAPDMAAMEKALEWLDEAVYLGKKVLVHCRHGIGRTGTFITAYLLRRGFGLKKAGKLLKQTRANPSNYSQWKLLRKFGKKEKSLTLGEPTPENRNVFDLNDYFIRYERLLEKVDRLEAENPPGDGKRNERACGRDFTLHLIEALYLHNKINIVLDTECRRQVIDRATNANNLNKVIIPGFSQSPCPLRQDGECLMQRYRPVHCRLRGMPAAEQAAITEELRALSRQVFQELFGNGTATNPPPVNCPDTVSGKFIQRYFNYLTSLKDVKNE